MAATKLTYVQTGTMIRDGYEDHFDKSMDSFLKRSDNIPLQGARFYVQENATTLTHKLTTWADVLRIPRQSEDTDPLPYDQPAPGYDKSISILTYRNAIKITKTLEKIDQSGKIGQMQGGLLNSGRRLLEFMYVDPINNGTTVDGADGSKLFANDHFHEDPSAGTWSNLHTAAALTTTSFNTGVVNLQKRKNEKGYVSPIAVRTLIVPPDLKMKARQIADSPLVPEDALNAINAYQGIQAFVYDHLTDTNGWILEGDKPEDEWGLHYVVLTPPEIMRLGYPSAEYPDISKGWRIKLQVAAAGSVIKNLAMNIGA